MQEYNEGLLEPNVRDVELLRSACTQLSQNPMNTNAPYFSSPQLFLLTAHQLASMILSRPLDVLEFSPFLLPPTTSEFPKHPYLYFLFDPPKILHNTSLPHLHLQTRKGLDLTSPSPTFSTQSQHLLAPRLLPHQAPSPYLCPQSQTPNPRNRPL
jgi:hypothetical protein